MKVQLQIKTQTILMPHLLGPYIQCVPLLYSYLFCLDLFTLNMPANLLAPVASLLYSKANKLAGMLRANKSKQNRSQLQHMQNHVECSKIKLQC